MALIYSEVIHLFLALFAGCVIYVKYRSLKGFFVALMSGFFIDIDHLFDLFMMRGWNLSISELFTGDHFLESRKVYLIFHAWEYLLILYLASFLVKRKHIIYALAFGLTVHLVWDQISNHPNIFAYSIIYRALNGFDISAFSS